MQQLGIDTRATTSYNPQCNGLVERMHRQLKSSLRAHLTTDSWQDALPLVLLGLRLAWPEGPEATPAELLYGSALRLPGQFIPGPELDVNKPFSSFITSFQEKMKTIKAAPSKHHSSAVTPFIPLSLRSSPQVFIRSDGVRKPLQNPYYGPYPVLERGAKTFKVM